ncbi:MAG TPA: hypothetical protein VHB20_01815 [Verrucomicrobiae bacterium]|nr:hypothetical protein [Verrucomicrobiae bacterium]
MLALILVLALVIYQHTRAISSAEKLFVMLPGGLPPEKEAFILRYEQWLNAQLLEYHCSFRFGMAQVSVFKQKDQPRYFSFLFHSFTSCCIDSFFDASGNLETSNSGSNGLYQHPRGYIQSFPKCPPPELWQRHLEGEQYLTVNLGWRLQPFAEPYANHLIATTNALIAHNRTQSLWPFRILYRFFVTRFAIRNKSIAQQLAGHKRL